MQKFTCPWCGDRPHSEFSYYCDEEGIPSARQAGSDPYDRIYIRSNLIGNHVELWQHTHGCRGWLKIVRHNLTHEVQDTVRGDKQPKTDKS